MGLTFFRLRSSLFLVVMNGAKPPRPFIAGPQKAFRVLTSLLSYTSTTREGGGVKRMNGLLLQGDLTG